MAVKSYAQGIGLVTFFCSLLRPSRAPLHAERLVLNFFTDEFGPALNLPNYTYLNSEDK